MPPTPPTSQAETSGLRHEQEPLGSESKQEGQPVYVLLAGRAEAQRGSALAEGDRDPLRARAESVVDSTDQHSSLSNARQ